jgi:predicted permease
LADFVPMVQRGGVAGVTIPGATPPSGENHFSISFGRASDGYFETVRQRLVRGRDFSPRDTSGAPLVIIVNEAMARRFWPGGDAIGKRVRFAGETAEREIVGVASNTKLASMAADTEPFFYVPALQHYRPVTTLHVRTAGTPADALAAVRRIVRDIDTGIAPLNGETMQERMSFALVPAKIAQGVFGVAGAIAVLLCAGGLYGLVSYTLAQRVKEIGIRTALGATPRNVFRLIVGSALRLTIVGVAVGIALAAGATRFLASLLYDVTPTDPITYVGAAVLLVALTLLAGFAAARQGLARNPVVALRHE